MIAPGRFFAPSPACGGGSPCALGGLLQRHGGFGLVLLARAESERGGGGVEPAAGAAGARAVQAAFQHLAHTFGLSRAHQRAKARHDLVGAPQRVQRAGGHAPRFARGAVAAGQGQRGQMAQARPARAVEPEQLAAPWRAVRAQSDAVQRQPDHRAFDAVFGDHGGDVRVVVLHADGGHVQRGGHLDRQPGAEEIRVQVMSDGLHGRACRAGLLRQLPGRAFQRRASLGVVQVAMHRRPVRAAAMPPAGGILEPGAEGQDGYFGHSRGRGHPRNGVVSEARACRARASSASSRRTLSRRAAASSGSPCGW
jgi:hypothetical protein